MCRTTSYFLLLALLFSFAAISLVDATSEKRLWHFEGHKHAIKHNFLATSDSFGYEGELGPDYWSSLNTEWETCGTGEEQSPVALNPDEALHDNPFDLSLHWTNLASPVELINNGHTFEIDVASNEAGKDSYLTWDGTNYTLLQFHFHQSSEHHVDTRSYPLEMHCVHQDTDGNLLVLGIFLNRDGNTARNGFLKQFWELIPESESTVEEEIEVDWSLLTDDIHVDSYWNYAGSLTTPPCTEGVTWVVLKKRISLSFSQWNHYNALLGFNSRFTQPHFDRTV
jgi:carbonic anhydrase